MRPRVRVVGARSRSRCESTREVGESTRGLGESWSGKIDPRVRLDLCRSAAIMPSVGMRRTTRVFGVVKGVDGARILRSGRRLWPESGVSKLKRATDGDEWLHSIIKNSNKNVNNNNNNDNNSSSSPKGKENGWAHDAKSKQEVRETCRGQVVTKKGVKAPNSGRMVKTPTLSEKVKTQNLRERESKRFGVIYTRKRKRMNDGNQENAEDKMFGIQFSRRQRRKTEGGEDGSLSPPCMLTAVVDVDTSCGSVFARFLSSVFQYMRRADLRLSELATFLFAEPLNAIFASGGIRFLQDTPGTRNGICKFFGDKGILPLFLVDFSAIPVCFMQMHLSLVLRIKSLSLEPVNNLLDVDDCDDMITERELGLLLNSVKKETTEIKAVLPEPDNEVNKLVLHPSFRASKLARRNARHGLNSRGVQKRRSSLRRRRARNPTLSGIHKANGILADIPLSTIASKNKLRSSLQSNSAVNPKVVTPTLDRVTRDTNISSCSANVLVVESDRCYRIEGATVSLEKSSSGEWVLAASKNGSTKYIHSAQKTMRPCSSNRVTHDVIWSEDENWKLEFPNRQDWLIFKDLYKQCYDRNVPGGISKVIPVPGVSVVFGYEDSNSASFLRPDAYISLKSDEVERALASRTAIYDLDSEDEQWLKKFNSEVLTETEQRDYLTEDNFELMVDSFEKTYYCCPDDFTDERSAVNLCKELGRREVVEAVYNYWMKKRKQKQSALLTIFQAHQVKKTPLVPKPVLRKKRSMKRQPSQRGRGKQPTLLKAMAAEQGILDGISGDHDALIKVEEAKISLKRYEESAILKRRRAQLLMENADLATFRAAMALRISEAARVAESADVAVSQSFD